MTLKNPIVSIIVPVYNHEAYVEEALSSIFEQTYRPLELIIIDDGSKDKSVQVVEAYLAQHGPNSQIDITFLQQPNQGAHNTINRGLQLAKGDYLTILNSDDYFHIRRFEVIVKKMLQEEAEWSFTRVHAIDETGKTAQRGNWWWTWYERCMLQHDLYPTTGFKLLQDNITVSTGNLFFSRKLFNEVGLFKDLKLAHDYDFAMRALAFGEPLFVREELYFYRLHSNNTAPKVLHLIHQELAEIHREHLVLGALPPKNALAPSCYNWPLTYPLYRRGLSLDNGLISYLEKLPSKESDDAVLDEMPLPAKGNGEKITLISHDLSLSGGPKLLADLAITLKNSGYSPSVISLHDGPMKKQLIAHKISVTVIPSFLAFWNAGHTIKRALKLLFVLGILWFKGGKRFIANTVSSWPIALTASLAFPWKTFNWYIHESCGPEALIPGGLGMKLFRKVVQKNRIGFWFGSAATKSVWEESKVTGNVVYWSGLKASTQNPKKKESIVNILSIGTGEPRKGFQNLVLAFIQLVKEKRIPEQVHLTLVGFIAQIPQMQFFNSDLILKIHEAGLQERVRFISTVQPEQLEELYSQADLYVQPSLMECLPLSLLKAMALGIPVVASAVDGCKEALEHGVSGLLYSPRNILALASCLEEIILDPAKGHSYGKRAQERFNNMFAKEATLENLMDQLSCKNKKFSSTHAL